MNSKIKIPSDHPYHYQKQVREMMDGQMAADDRVEAIKEKANEGIEKANDRIEAQKISEQLKRQDKRNLVLIILGLVITVVIGVIQIIQALKD